jgi:hypothetical protein
LAADFHYAAAAPAFSAAMLSPLMAFLRHYQIFHADDYAADYATYYAAIIDYFFDDFR